MSKTKQKILDQIKADILYQNICPNLAKTANHLVFGEGNIDAQILFIGEAPGKKEDETGLPFVGASGKSLNEMLASIGMNRRDVYITNIVKYRPPDNRDPSAVEKAEFLPFLHRQIGCIGPKLVVTLGRHSMNTLLPKLKISEAHGQVFEIDGQKYLPLFHPAAAMYNGKLRQTLRDDFAKIPAVLNKS